MRWLPVYAALLASLLAGACAGGRQPAPPRGFSATDAAWLQLMIPMDERALPMLDLGAERGSTPQVRELGASPAEEHRAHLDQSLKVTRGERDSGSDPRAPAMAAELEETRAGQLKALPAVE